MLQDGGSGNDDLDDLESDDSFRANEENDSDFSRGESELMDVDMEDAENEAAEELGRLSPVSVDNQDTTRALRAQRRTRITQTKPDTILNQNSRLLNLVDDDGKPFPGVYRNDLLDQYQDAMPHNATSDFSSRPPQSPALSYQGPETQHTETVSSSREIPQSSISAATHTSKKGVSFDEGVLVADSRRAQPQSYSDSDDDDDDDDGDSDDNFEFQPDIDSGDLATDSDDSDDTSTSSASSSASLASSSSASSSSTSSSDEEPGGSNSRSSPAAVKHTDLFKSSGVEAQQHEAPKAESQAMNPPGTGKPATANRNQRRRRQKRLDHLKRIGVLASDATLNDLREFELSGNGGDVATSDLTSRGSRSTATSVAAEFERRRQELLASLESGGVEITANGKEKRRLSLGLERQGIVESVIQEAQEKSQDDHPTVTEQSGPVQTNVDKPSQRRTKLDIASSRRMVFGSLGLKVPKTKEDEDKLRSRHDVSRGQAPRPNGDALEKSKSQGSMSVDANGLTGEQQFDETDDCWKEKIILSAVECCEEGINLSTPPFPFVQRWDPQQHFPKSASKKAGKKRKRNQAKYYEGDEKWHGAEDMEGFFDIDYELDYDEPQEDLSNEVSREDEAVVDGHVPNQVGKDAQGSIPPPQEQPLEHLEEEDLPAMPADPETCVDLHQSDIRPGAVICFRQLKMTDNWQPEISGLRTARVEKFLENDIVQMILAKRDREKKRRTYDEEGRRIYGKFEMPDDEEAQSSDEGLLELPFADLIEPKLLQAGVSTPLQTEVEQQGADGVQNEQIVNNEPDSHLESDVAAQNGRIVSDEPDINMDLDIAAQNPQVSNNEPDIHMDLDLETDRLLYESDGLHENAEKQNSPEIVEPGMFNEVSIPSLQAGLDGSRDEVTLGSSLSHGFDFESPPPSPKSSPDGSVSKASGPSTQPREASSGLMGGNYEMISDARASNGADHTRLSGFPPAEEQSPAEGDDEDSLGDGLFVKQTHRESLLTKLTTPNSRTQIMQQDYSKDVRHMEARSSSSGLPSPSKIFSMSYTSSQSVKKEQSSIAVSPPPRKSNSQEFSAAVKDSRFAVNLTHFGFPESNRVTHQPSPSEIIDLTQDSGDETTMDTGGLSRYDGYGQTLSEVGRSGWNSKDRFDAGRSRRLGGSVRSRRF